MEGKFAANRTTAYHGGSSICREILRLDFHIAEATAVADAFYRKKMCLLGVGENNGMETPGLRGLNNESKAIQGRGRGRGSCRVVMKKEHLDWIIHMGIFTGVTWDHMGRLVSATLAFRRPDHKIAVVRKL